MQHRDGREVIAFTKARRGLTLFELMVVVTIAVILFVAAIYSSGSILTRTKVSRVKEDHRVVMRALQNYSVDNSGFPPTVAGLASLVRPSTYLGVLPTDPFQRRQGATYLYIKPDSRDIAAVLVSPGPDGDFDLPMELWQFVNLSTIDGAMIPASAMAMLQRAGRQMEVAVGAARPSGRAESGGHPADGGPVAAAAGDSGAQQTRHGEGADRAPALAPAMPSRPMAGTMTEAHLSALTTYINLAQFDPERGGDGDIITVIWY